jgi:hypothetical protein
VRASVIINERQIIKDEEVHKLVCRYMTFLILRLLGSSVLLNDKQKAFLEVIVKYFYIRFMLQYHHSMARETALMSIDDEYKDEADSLMPTLKRYTSMKDIFKAMVDYQIVNDSPSLLIVKALNKFKPLVFYSLISSLDYIVALAVTSQYPADFLSGALINNDVQKKLEKKIDKYIRMIKFDVNAMKKI